MGAHSFERRWDGADPQAGFDAMHQDDLASYGHDPYTGDIGQKSGFTVLSRTPVSEDQARRLADEFMDEADKWDDTCGAIPLAGRGGKTATRKPSIRATSEREAKRLLREKYGDDLKKIVRLEPKGVPHSGKVAATKRDVKPRIIWTVNGQGAHPNKTAATKAARERAKAFAAAVKAGEKKYVNASDGEYFVAPAVAQSEAALVLKVGLFDKPVAWAVEVEVQKVDTSKPGSWLFVGVAAS